MDSKIKVVPVIPAVTAVVKIVAPPESFGTRSKVEPLFKAVALPGTRAAAAMRAKATNFFRGKGRNADAGGLNGFVNFIQTGGIDQAVVAGIFSSQEASSNRG